MELIDYIDADEGRECEMQSSDADCCENCGRSGERLTRVPEFDYMGCDDCMEEALAVIKRESCEHVNVRVEFHEDVNEDYHYVREFEEIICCDCGQELIEKRNGDLVACKRRAA